MKQSLSSVLFVLLLVAGVGACASTQKPAPGASPGDMSPEEHRAEAAEHEQEAGEHEDQADRAQKMPQAAAHEGEAHEHSDIAEQHEAAAEAADSGE